MARVSSYPPSAVPLLQTSQVCVPVCFRMDTSMGLGLWALALGGAWAFALGACLGMGFSLARGCWEQPPATFRNVRDPTARLPSSPARLFNVCCDAAGWPLLGWVGFVCRGGGGCGEDGACCFYLLIRQRARGLLCVSGLVYYAPHPWAHKCTLSRVAQVSFALCGGRFLFGSVCQVTQSSRPCMAFCGGSRAQSSASLAPVRLC